MRGRTRQLRRGVFGAGVALSLAFGATQAFATPSPVVDDGPKCRDSWCNTVCKAIGAFSGSCTPSGGCACAL